MYGGVGEEPPAQEGPRRLWLGPGHGREHEAAQHQHPQNRVHHIKERRTWSFGLHNEGGRGILSSLAQYFLTNHRGNKPSTNNISRGYIIWAAQVGGQEGVYYLGGYLRMLLVCHCATCIEMYIP